MYRYILFTLFTFSFVYGANFEELKQKALQNSNQIKIKDLDIQIAKKDLELSNSQFYPSVSMGFNIEKSKSLDNSSGGSYVGDNYVSNDTMKKSYGFVNLNYNIYSFGRTSTQKEVKKYQVKTSQYEYCKSINSIYLNLLENYFYARNYQIKNSFLKKIIEQKNSIYIKNKRLYDSGNLNKIDLLKSSIDVANLYNQITQNRKQEEEYKQNISNIINQELNKDEKLEPLDTSSIEISNEFENTSTAKSLINQIKSKQAQIDLYNKEYLPNLNAYYKYDIYGNDKSSYSEAIKDMSENSYKFGLNFYWEIFSGFKTSIQKEKTQLELKQLRYKYELEKQNFNSKIKILTNNYELEKSNKQNIEKSLEETLSNQEYSNRLNSIGEISKTQEISYEVEANYKQMEYELNEEKKAYEFIKKVILFEARTKCIMN